MNVFKLNPIYKLRCLRIAETLETDKIIYSLGILLIVNTMDHLIFKLTLATSLITIIILALVPYGFYKLLLYIGREVHS